MARALPAGDVRKLAWLNSDRYASAWVATWPSNDAWMSDSEFIEVTTRYFGLLSPACAALVGQPIGRSRSTLDEHGFRLCAATVPGDGWRRQHDTIKWALYEDMRLMNTRVTAEVFGLFAPLLPHAARDEIGAQPVRKRQGPRKACSGLSSLN